MLNRWIIMLNKSVSGLVLLLALVSLTGCSQMEARFEQRVEPHLSHITFYQQPVLARSEQESPVYPVNMATNDLKTLFFPFYVHSEGGGNYNTGRRIGHIFWRTWLGQEVFPSMPYEDAQQWPGKNKAGELARSMDADLYVLGQVNHYLNGGTQGTTSITLLVNIYSSKNDQIIWSMEHSGRMENRGEMDFILFKRKNWMPESPEYVIVNNLSYDLAQPVKSWSQGFVSR